jgi:hypothetical protein
MIEDQIAAALLKGGDLLTVNDLRSLAAGGRVQWWGDERVAIGTEVLAYPRRKLLNCFMAAGDIAGILALQDDVVAFATTMGCTHMVAHGQPGWGRVGRAHGWRPHSVQFVREVPP